MKEILLLLLIAVLGAVPAQAGEMRRLTVNDVERTYYLHVPTGLERGAPLVIMLHGASDDGKDDVGRYGWEHMANNNQFVVAGPDASAVRADRAPGPDNIRAWNSGRIDAPANIARSDDTALIVAMIDDIARTDGIDLRRVYVAGFSSGGDMANRLGQEIADRLAAISTSASDMIPLSKPPSRGLPVLFSAGDRDPHTPVNGGMAERPWDSSLYKKEPQRALVDRWRTLDACPAPHTIPGPQGTLIEVSGPCRDGSEVRYVLMHGVDHKWPTDHPIGLTQASWHFFKRFSLPAAPAGN